MAGTVVADTRRPPAARSALDPVRHPRHVSRPGRVVTRRPGPLGCLGGAVPGSAGAQSRGGQAETPPEGRDAGSHPHAHPAAAGTASRRHRAQRPHRDASAACAGLHARPGIRRRRLHLPAALPSAAARRRRPRSDLGASGAQAATPDLGSGPCPAHRRDRTRRGRVLGLGARGDVASHRNSYRGTSRTDPVVAAALHRPDHRHAGAVAAHRAVQDR